MRHFPDPEELVAAYWRKLARSVESGGATPHSKTQTTNGRLQSRLSRDGGRMRQRSAALRNGKHSPATHSARRGKVTTALRQRTHSNSTP